MSEYPITYEMARERHPKELEQVRVEVARSGSKYKTKLVEQWQFFYSTHQEIQGGGMRGDEFMRKLQSGELAREKDEKMRWKDTATLEDRIQRYMEGLHISLSARLTPRGGSYGVPLNSIPPEIQADIRETSQQEVAERARFNALTPAEREAETQGLLAQLRGSPGFTEIHIGEDGRAQAMMQGLQMDLSPEGNVRMTGPRAPEAKAMLKAASKTPPKEKPKKRDKWSGGAIQV